MPELIGAWRDDRTSWAVWRHDDGYHELWWRGGEIVYTSGDDLVDWPDGAMVVGPDFAAQAHEAVPGWLKEAAATWLMEHSL